MPFNDYCNPCERRSIESKSDGWCCECEEGLCDKCLQDHKAIKMTQYHHVVKITSHDLGDNYHLLSIPKCERHAELKEDLLCKDHDVVCCNGCLVTDHKACRNVVPLDVAAKGVKSSELFEAIKGAMVVNKKVSNKIIKERQASKEELNRQELRIRKEIANIKSRFMEHINNLEKSLLSELAAISKENTAESEKEKQVILKIEKKIEADENALTFVAENGSQGQIFSFLRKLKKKQLEIKEKLENISPTSRLTITLEESTHQIEAITSLGFLSVRYDSVSKSQGQTDQRAMSIRQGELCPLLKVEKEMGIDTKHFLKKQQTYEDLSLFINDFAITEDSQLLVIGNLVTVNKGTKYESNSQLVKYDVDMKFVESYNIDVIDHISYGCINLMTCISKSHQVVVTDKTRLHFVNSKTITQMWPSVCLTQKSTILDVTANIIHIFVLQFTFTDKPKFIQVCDLVGRQLKTIHFGNNMNYTSITLQPNGNFLCRVTPDYSCGCVCGLAFVEPEASNIHVYGRYPNAVTVDRNGNIYMAVGNGIDMMHHREQHVQRVFTFPDTEEQVVGIESYKDNNKFCILFKNQQNEERKFGTYGCVINTYSYSLQVLTGST